MPNRITRWLGGAMPKRDDLAENRFIKPFAGRVLRSEIWRFTRRSVPRGVALGMLAGFLIPVSQVFVAAFLALPLRANLPIAAVTTLITNPFTYPFWIVAANKVGGWMLQFDALTHGQPHNTEVRSEFGQWLAWFMEQAVVTAYGFVVLGVLFASFGYLVAIWCWRWWVGRKWRQLRRQARAMNSSAASDGRDGGDGVRTAVEAAGDGR